MAAKVTVATVSEFVIRRKKEKVSILTVNRDLTAFVLLMNAIKNSGWLEVNPVLLYEKQGMKEVLPDIVLPTEHSIQKLSARTHGTLQYFPLPQYHRRTCVAP